MESLVSGIKQLNGVLVVVMPDCLLYSAWQRPGQTWDTEVVGAYLGELVRAHLDGLDAIEGWSDVKQMTVELDRALVVLRRVKDPFIVGYVFDKGAAIGWARLQIQRTIKAIERSLDSGPVESVPTPPPPAPRERVIIAEPPEPVPPEPPPPEPPPPAPEPVYVAPPEPVQPESVPEHLAQSTGTGPHFDKAGAHVAPIIDTPAGDEEEPEPAVAEEDMPKGTRLIKYLDAHAPDTHAALLRVSLQTGLPLTLLRMPDSLSDDEFAQVEESVRRILGVEQLNF